jgi:amidohydrolase
LPFSPAAARRHTRRVDRAEARRVAHQRAERAHPSLVGLSHRIHASPELGFAETQASGWLAELLEKSGFEVERGVGELPTALAAHFGPGPLRVALMAEYDALPEVGHACGHNVIATAAIGAGIALAGVAEALGLRVSVIGTPAEEGGAGKELLLRAGVFDGVHLALMVHPGPSDLLEPRVLAARSLLVTYRGRPAHAAAFPERGINAADALVVAQVAIGLLRQALPASQRVHGIVTAGGDAPNIIPALTSAHFMIRAETLEELAELEARVRRCFEAGATASGAELQIDAQIAYAELRSDADLLRLYRANAEELGRSFEANDGPLMTNFSTDAGNVSRAVPTIHPIIGIDSAPAVNHQPEFAAATITPAADRAILDGAIALAWTAIDAACDEALRARLLAG